jgi:hypothetical protein
MATAFTCHQAGRVFAFIKALEFGGGGCIANHFIGIMRNLRMISSSSHSRPTET